MELFHPIVNEWFKGRFAGPTEIQTLAWPKIASNSHVLVSAPTGTGKTLTVFLMALDKLIREGGGSTRVLYVSPLKALNNDIRENLMEPLSQLKAMFEARAVPFPDIRVVVRSGDTPQSERQRMLRKPPEILITTPESLNLLLSSPKAREILTNVETVILDEIHAIAAGKRGTHLMTAVERLALLSGEFQRIAVSATVRPLQVIADFVGGYYIDERAGGGGVPTYTRRKVEVVEATGSKATEISVEFPLKDMRLGGHDTVWHLIADPIRRIVKENTSTLVFVNSRRLAENMTHIINDDGDRMAYAHHGSLSRELRSVVEKRLKGGELSAIVATTSLEMGIDIGKLDKVVLIQTPFSVSSAVQRIGRSGHSVDQSSSGTLFPSHGMDLVHAAVMARLVSLKDVEKISPVRCPLDVLSQVIISMLGIQTWDLDELFNFIRCVSAYRDLREQDYRSVLTMLAGRYKDTRIRELRPRILIDEVTNTARGGSGALLLIYSSGGTIPDRGYFSLRLHDTRARIGELDEEFVWERKTGDTFTLGTQSWKIMKMDHQKVEVVPWKGPVKIQPFWKGETVNRDSHYSLKIADFLEMCNQRLEDPSLSQELKDLYFLDEDASEALVSYLAHQRVMSGADIPHRHHLLIEHAVDPSTGGEMQKIFIHTLWGNRVNYPLSLIITALLERGHLPVEVMSDNHVIVLQVANDPLSEGDTEAATQISELIASIDPEEIDTLIRGQLERGGFFGARFRENAGRALLLPRSGAGRRTPLWVNRLKAKRLMDAVSGYKDFPILLETWRTCIQDEFELDELRTLLQEVADGDINITEISTAAPSPFAEGSIWQTINEQLYADDTPRSGARPPGVDESILREAVFSPSIRPDLDPEIIAEFQRKAQRTEDGYSPRPGDELTEWIGERLAVPVEEWQQLLIACERDHAVTVDDIVTAAADRCVVAKLPGAVREVVVSVSGLAVLHDALEINVESIELRPIVPGQDTDEIVSMTTALISRRNARKQADSSFDEEVVSDESVFAQWLSYYGPVARSLPGEVFGFAPGDVDEMLSTLFDAKSLVADHLTEGVTGEEICDAQNLERLLAFTRRRNRGSFEARPAELLQPFLAHWQRISRPGHTQADLKNVLMPLFGYGAKAGQWEEEILPARLTEYRSYWLDELLRTTDLEWTGHGDARLGFAFPEDQALFTETANVSDPETDTSTMEDGLDALFPDRLGRYSFWDLKDRSGLSSGAFTDRLWKLVWKGLVKCDSYEVVRNGALRGFKETAGGGSSAPSRRRSAGLAQWQSSRPIAGNWFLAAPESQGDLLDLQETNKDRIRLLLQRYGVLFRELLAYEARPMGWSRLFRTMRLMELSGEIVGGHFFEGIQGLQFASPAALRTLKAGIDEEAVFWINAADPASLCGVDVPALKEILPERYPSTFMVFHGRKLVIVARKKGAELEIKVDPDSESLPAYLGTLKVLTTRNFNPQKSVKVKMVNGSEASESGYGPALEDCGFVKDYQGYSLWAL